MEQLMVDLLEATRGQPKKYDGIPPYVRSTFQCQSFIRQEDLRSEPSLFTTEESSRFSFLDDNARFSEGASTNAFPKVEHESELSESDISNSSLSYVSYGNLSHTPSPPTYIPGDFHDISPQEPSSKPTTCTSRELASPQVCKKLPFSIDTLLGDVIQDRTSPSLQSSPASVVSSVHGNFHTTYIHSNNETPEYSMTRQRFDDPQRQPVYDYQMFSQIKASQVNATVSSLFWCHACARFCSSADSAQRHNTTHALEGAKCELRDAIFRQYGYVTTHENTGFLERVKCGLCNKIVCGRYFIRHVRVHNGHQCETCSKEFSSKSRLRDHKNEHTGESPYPCAECPRRFGSRAGWAQHMRRHRDFKSFGCRFCEKRFNSKDSCAVHERIHTGNNPYKCVVLNCGRSFPQKVQLNHHMYTHI